MMANPAEFIQSLANFDRDNMSVKMVEFVDKKLADENMTPVRVQKASLAAAGCLAWMIGLVAYKKA
jgi:hypothetical protein